MIPDSTFVEMPRNSERSFCCGAGGARMWMEETIGTRINETRTKEAVGTGADQIAVGCPFCRVMLSDGLTAAQSKGEAREEVEVLDVAQMLLAAVKGETTSRPRRRLLRRAGQGRGRRRSAGGTATATIERQETKAEPEAGDTTQTDETVTDTEDVGPAAKASGGTSLFDLGDDSDVRGLREDEPARGAEPEPEAKADDRQRVPVRRRRRLRSPRSQRRAEAKAEASGRPSPRREKPAAVRRGLRGGSLFDVGGDDAEEPAERPPSRHPRTPARTSTAARTTPTPTSSPTSDQAPRKGRHDAEPREQEPKPSTASSGTGATPGTEIPEGGSLFDIEAPAEEPVGPARRGADPPRTPARTSTAARTTPTPTSNPSEDQADRGQGRDEPTRTEAEEEPEAEEAPASSGDRPPPAPRSPKAAPSSTSKPPPRR